METNKEETEWNRRSFLGRSAGALVGFGCGGWIPKTLAGGGGHPGNQLRLPPVFENGGDLVVSPTTLPIWPGHSTAVFAINGSVPGPTIRLTRGEEFQARVVNQLVDQDLVLHWHGILAPEKMDGHPRDQVAPGETYDLQFPINQRGATCWYHSHTDLLTAEQVYMGLAGFFLIDDPEQDALNLPTGDHDVPLVISDWRSNAQFQLTYTPTMPDRVRGYLGDTTLVNGTPAPYLSVDQGRYRFRLLNGSNARIFKIAFSDNRSFHLIGTDGGLLPEPLEVTNAILTPGQRLEILVDFSDLTVGESLILRSLGVPRDMGPMSPSQDMSFNLLTFYVDQAAPAPPALPPELIPLDVWEEGDALRTRTFTLTMVQGVHYINGLLFEMDAIRFAIPQGELEIWEYVNNTNAYHPMHMHATHFQVLERVGRSLAPEDGGWKDTILVSPGERVRVLMRFDAHPGLFLHHCHNLEHEDAGMMQNFEVLPLPELPGADLQIECAETSCVISWSDEVSGQLEASPDLSPDSWQPVPETPVLADGRQTVTVPIDASGAQFYRLAYEQS